VFTQDSSAPWRPAPLAVDMGEELGLGGGGEVGGCSSQTGRNRLALCVKHNILVHMVDTVQAETLFKSSIHLV
jgi:hypothetical protein